LDGWKCLEGVSGILYSSSEVELRQSAPQVSHRDA